MCIDLPSSRGARSTTPCSLICSANLSKRSRPICGWVNSRPRNWTATLTLSPSSRNSIARRTFVSKSPMPILGFEADLFEGDGSLPPLGFLLTLGEFVLVLTEIQESRHRRTGQRCDLHQIEPPLLRKPQGVGRSHDAKLATVFVDNPHVEHADHLIDAQVSADGEPLLCVFQSRSRIEVRRRRRAVRPGPRQHPGGRPRDYSTGIPRPANGQPPRFAHIRRLPVPDYVIIFEHRGEVVEGWP